MSSTMRKAACDFYKIFLVLILFATITPAALAAPATTGNGASTNTDANMTPSQTMKYWIYRNPSGGNFAATQFGGADRLVPVTGAGQGVTGAAGNNPLAAATGATGGSAMLKSDGPGITTPYGIIQSWPVVIPPAPATVPTWRDTAITKNLLPTYGFPVSDSQFQMIQRFNDNIMIEELSNPERLQWLMGTMGQQMATGTGDSAGQAASNQTQNAIEFSRRYLVNFTADGGNEWNTMRNQLFIPIAILLLLPGAVLAQVRAIVAQGYYTIFGEINPFEGILRSIVAVFLIPATYLVVNYGIDVSNSLSLTVAQGYTNIFGTNMYEDAKCLQRRSAAVNPPERNDNAIINSENPNANQSGGTWPGQWEAQTHTVRQFDPCAGVDKTTVTNESMTDARATNRLIMNLMNATMGSGWLIMCAFQVVFLLYLFVMGPIVAALWVWPINALRQALPSWIEGVCKLCFWSFLWNVVILLMACFRGYGEDGMAVASALNALANLAVLSGFDFSSLVSNAAGYLQQAVSSAGGSGGSSTGSQSGSGVGKASSSATGAPSGSRSGGPGSRGGRPGAIGGRPGMGGVPGGPLGPGGTGALTGGPLGPGGTGALGGGKTDQATGVTTAAGLNSKGMPASVTAPGNMKDPGVPGQGQTGPNAPGHVAGQTGADPPLTGANGMPLGQGGVNQEAGFLSSHPNASTGQMAQNMMSHVDPQSALGQYLQQHPDQQAGAAGYLATHPNVGENQLGQALAAESARGNHNPTVGQLDKDLHQFSSPDLANKTLGGPDNTNLASALDHSGLMGGVNHPAGVTLDNAAMVANPTEFGQGAANAGAIDGLNGAKLVDQSGHDMSKYFDAQGHLTQALPPGEHVSALDPKTGQAIGSFDPNAANGQGHWNGTAPGVGLDANGHWSKDGLNAPLVYDGKANGFEVAGANGAPSGIALDSATGNLKLEGSNMPVTTDNLGHFQASVNGQAMAYDGNSWSAQGQGANSGIGANSQFNWDANAQHMALNGTSGSVYLDNSGGASHLAMAGSGAPVSMDQAGGLHTHIGNTDFNREANSQNWTAAGVNAPLEWNAAHHQMEAAGTNGGVAFNANNQHLELANTNHQVQLTPDAAHPGMYQASVGGQAYEYNPQSHSFSAPGTSEPLSWNGASHQMEAAPGVAYNSSSHSLELAGTNHIPLTADAAHPGMYSASVGGQAYEYNPQSHSFSAPGTSEPLSWNAASHQMEAAPGVAYNPGSHSLELAGSNHVPLTPEANNPGHYQASVGGQTYEYNSQSHSFSAPGTSEQLSWNASSHQMEAAPGVAYNPSAPSGQHLELAGTNHVPLTPEANNPGHYQASVGGQTYEYNSQTHAFSAPGTSEQLSWNASSHQMEAASGVAYNPGSHSLELAGSNHIPLTPEANNPGHYQASVNGQTYEYNSQTHSFSAPNAPEALSWNGAHQQMEVSGSNGGVTYNSGSQHLELAGTNHVPLTPEANHPGYYQASVGGQTYEYNSQNHSFSAPGTSEQLSWNASHQQMEAAPGVVYNPSAPSGQHLELAGTNHIPLTPEANNPGHYQASVNGQTYEYNAQSHSFSAPNAPEALSWNSAHQQMEVSGSNGGVVYNQGSQHLELAGTNHQVQLTPEANHPGYYQASVGGQSYEYNSQSHSFSAPGTSEQLSWNASHQQMEAAPGVVYNPSAPSGQNLELAGTNHQVQLTPEANNPGYYQASVGGQTYEYNSQTHAFSAPNAPEALSWNPAHQQMEVAGSNGSVVYNQGSQHLELAGTNHQVQLTPEPNSPGMYSIAGTNYEYNANSHSFSAPGTAEPLSWNPAQHQMEASPGVAYNSGSQNLELAGTNHQVQLTPEANHPGYYSTNVNGQSYEYNSQTHAFSSSTTNAPLEWNSTTQHFQAQNSGGDIVYNASHGTLEAGTTHTPVSYDGGNYYAANSNHHIAYDQQSHQFVAASEHFHNYVPVTPTADSSTYAVANSGGQLYYNPSSDAISVAGSSGTVQATPTPDGSYYVASTTYGGQQVVLPADSNQFYAGQTPVHMTDQGWAPIQQQQPVQTTYNDYSAPITTASYTAPTGDQYTAPITTASFTGPVDQPTPVSYNPGTVDNSAAQYAANLQHQQEIAQRLAEAQAAERAAEANAGYTNNPTTYADLAQAPPPVHYDNSHVPAPPEPPRGGLNSLVMGTLPVASRPNFGQPAPKAPANQEVAATETPDEARSTNESLQDQMARLQKRGSGYEPSASQRRAWHKKYGRPWNTEDGEIEEV